MSLYPHDITSLDLIEVEDILDQFNPLENNNQQTAGKSHATECENNNKIQNNEHRSSANEILTQHNGNDSNEHQSRFSNQLQNFNPVNDRSRRSKKQAKKLNSTTNIANSPIPVELAINKKAASPGRKIPKLRGENTPEKLEFYDLLKRNGFHDVKEFVPIHNEMFPNHFIDQSNVSKSLSGKRQYSPGLKMALLKLSSNGYNRDPISNPPSPVGSPYLHQQQIQNPNSQIQIQIQIQIPIPQYPQVLPIQQ